MLQNLPIAFWWKILHGNLTAGTSLSFYYSTSNCQISRPLLRALLQLLKTKAISQAQSKIEKFLHLLCTLLPPPRSLSGEVEWRHKCCCSISSRHQTKLYMFISKEPHHCPLQNLRYDTDRTAQRIRTPAFRAFSLYKATLREVLLLVLQRRRIPITRVFLSFILAIPTSY